MGFIGCRFHKYIHIEENLVNHGVIRLDGPNTISCPKPSWVKKIKRKILKPVSPLISPSLPIYVPLGAGSAPQIIHPVASLRWM